MENEEKNLNTEANDIAGNRIDGPVGNTAARQTQSGLAVGIPGGAPGAAAHDIDSSTASASSESLADSETRAGEGAVGDNLQAKENVAADPAHLVPTGAYGGNFGNSTQASYRDQSRRDNQDSDANRGEFGAQDLDGTTHGGFGNQNRQADYEPRGSAEDQYYGGPGRPGHQENAYRAYDGRDERPDNRSKYGFEPGTAQAPEAGLTSNPSNAHLNDNGAPKGPDSSYAADYGHTSLRSDNASSSQNKGPATLDRRNQTENYLPAQAGYDNQGRHDEQQHPIARQGSAGGSNAHVGDDRSGYVQDPSGDTAEGLGSRGGSYNDAYDDSKPGSTVGSPAVGDQRTEDLSPNYGATARQENRADNADTDDHGAPHRNAGRDGGADE